MKDSIDEDFLLSILDAQIQQIAVIDAQGEIVWINQSWRSFSYENSGRTDKTDLGTNYIEVCKQAAKSGDQYGRDALVGINAVINGEMPSFTLEYPCNSPDEPRWFSMQCCHHMSNRRPNFVITHQLITERKLAEIRLQAQFELLVQTNITLEQYSRAAAHDLQSPVRNIMTLIGMMREDCGQILDATAADYVSRIEDQTARLQSLLTNMLAYSKLEVVDFQKECKPLSEAVDLAVSDLEIEIEATGAILSVGDLPVLSINVGFISQLFQNLISNAVKYRDGQPNIEIGCRQNGEDWEIWVSDDGIGIEDEYVDRIFDPMTRLHSHFDIPGTGLGLSICKRIVEMHGGTIWLEESKRNRTEFRFTLSAEM